jgi:general secretion pathway protein A
MLERPELEQLAQRVIARYHLDSLSAAETAAYIRHRMSVAGLTTLPPFKPKLMKLIHQITQGVPRRINLLCDRALLGAYAESKHQIDKSIISKAAAEAFGRNRVSGANSMQRWHYALWGVVAGVAMIGAVLWSMNHGWPSKSINIKSKSTESPSAATAAVKATPAAISSEKEKTDQSVLPSPSGAVTGASVSQAVQPQSSAHPALWDLDDIFTTRLPYRVEAIRELAQLWGLSLEVGLPCLLAQQADLHCYITNKIELAEIRRLNRPAVLTLHDDAGQIYYALLTGLSQANATLRVGGVSQSVSVSTLTRVFRGGFLTLWRAPYTYRELIGLGFRGEEADWIAEQLAKKDGKQIPRHNQMYDQKMVQVVREFQRAQGIQADGIVGPKTFMQLNRVVGIKEPLLQGRTASAIALAE